MTRSALYHGAVMHHRHQPKRHHFVYRITSWLIDIDELPELDRTLFGFAYNRFSLFSLYDKDYGFADGRPLREFIDHLMADHQLPHPHRVELLCQVRSLGMLFNPLVVWFCYTPDNRLSAVVYEVRNTFGQRHHYLVPVTHPEQAVQQHRASKCFYVSPFMEMDCEYRFRFKAPDERLQFAIHQYSQARRMLTATWAGDRAPLTQKNLLAQVIRNPVSAVKIFVSIHWEALRLWCKGLKLIKRPAPPVLPVTSGQSACPNPKAERHES